MNFIKNLKQAKTGCYIILLCAAVLVLSTVGIRDENVIEMNGDMQKYLMNGVFFHDFLRDGNFANPLNYAYKYFARYPALSLGHHPMFLGLAEVPFYSLFGVSVFSARLTIVFFMLLGAIAWFQFVRSVYNEEIALLSSLLFVTTPFIVRFSRIVMSEIPTLSMIILTVYFFYEYCETEQKRYAIASAVCLSLSIYSKHIAAFLIPFLFLYLLLRKGIRYLIRKEILASYVVVAVLLMPLLIITLKFSRANLDFAAVALSSKSPSYIKPLSDRFIYYINVLWTRHLEWPVIFLSILSIVMSVYKRDRRITIFILWILILYIFITYIGWQESRYAIYWIPVFCLFASSVMEIVSHRAWKIAMSSALLIIAGYQFTMAYQEKPDFAEGYETAARYVTENNGGEIIMYSGVEDTGYFIFFVRKFNPDNDMIVLRADKILATSKMNWIVEERIKGQEEIYGILKSYGVKYVVIEDIPSRSQALEWLREAVKTDKFILKKEIIIKSRNKKINNVPLTIYEYKEYQPPDKGQILKMNIPLMGGFIKLPLKDLL